jgi:hypothetical protein
MIEDARKNQTDIEQPDPIEAPGKVKKSKNPALTAR